MTSIGKKTIRVVSKQTKKELAIKNKMVDRDVHINDEPPNKMQKVHLVNGREENLPFIVSTVQQGLWSGTDDNERWSSDDIQNATFFNTRACSDAIFDQFVEMVSRNPKLEIDVMDGIKEVIIYKKFWNGIKSTEELVDYMTGDGCPRFVSMENLKSIYHSAETDIRTMIINQEAEKIYMGNEPFFALVPRGVKAPSLLRSMWHNTKVPENDNDLILHLVDDKWITPEEASFALKKHKTERVEKRKEKRQGYAAQSSSKKLQRTVNSKGFTNTHLLHSAQFNQMVQDLN